MRRMVENQRKEEKRKKGNGIKRAETKRKKGSCD
jgi:hypothetical protein